MRRSAPGGRGRTAACPRASGGSREHRLADSAERAHLGSRKCHELVVRVRRHIAAPESPGVDAEQRNAFGRSSRPLAPTSRCTRARRSPRHSRHHVAVAVERARYLVERIRHRHDRRRRVGNLRVESGEVDIESGQEIRRGERGCRDYDTVRPRSPFRRGARRRSAASARHAQRQALPDDELRCAERANQGRHQPCPSGCERPRTAGSRFRMPVALTAHAASCRARAREHAGWGRSPRGRAVRRRPRKSRS